MSPWWMKLLRDLWRRRGPFLAVAVTSLLGVMLFGATYDAYRNLQSSYREMFVRLDFADLTVEGGELDAFVAAARETDGVQAVATRSVREVPLDVAGERLIGRLVEIPTGGQPAVNKLLVLEGNYLAADAEDAVLVERHLAEHFGLAPGDEVRIRTLGGWSPVEVAGVVASPEYVWPARSRQQVLTTPDTFGVLFVPAAWAEGGVLPSTRQALVYIDPNAERDAALQRLRDAADAAAAARVITRAEQPSNALLQEDIQGFGELAVLFPLLFLGAAMVAAFVVIARLVQEERRSIGTLRASGVGARAILLHHLGFGVVPGAVGALVGAVLGEIAAVFITERYTGALDVPITVVRFHPEVAAGGFALAVALLAAASAIPAWRASRVRPAEAMAGGERRRAGGSVFLERIVPALKRLPASGKLVVRSLGRHPGRSATTALGVMLALLLVMVSWGMLDTVRALLHRQFDVIQRHDAEVVPVGDVQVALEAIRGVDGIAAAEAVVNADAEAVVDGARLDTGLRAFPEGTSMHGFRVPGGRTIALPADGALVTTSLRDELGLAVGDELSLRLAARDARLVVPVAGFVAEPLGTWTYLQRPVVAAGGTEIAPTTVLVRVAEDADRQAVLDEVETLDAVAAVVGTDALRQLVNDFLSLFYMFVGIMLVLGAVLGFALIYAAMSVNIAERTRELATLRAFGVHHRRLAVVVTLENLLVAGLALVPGLPLAYFATAAFLASFSSPLFRFELVVQPWTWVLACASVLLAVLLSQAPALRSVARLDLAEAVRVG